MDRKAIKTVGSPIDKLDVDTSSKSLNNSRNVLQPGMFGGQKKSIQRRFT